MKRTILTAALLIALPALCHAGQPLAAFDVAEDQTRFVFGAAPVFEDGMPAYGNAFVTQGYIYPAGTLDGGVEGVMPDGSPSFPEKVLGRWTCDGVFIGNGMHTETGAFVMTRQVYEFDGGDILVSHGPEIVDIGGTVIRAVTGGTGDYGAVGPDLRQTFLGMSDGLGVRLQIEIDIAPQKAGAKTPYGSDADSERRDAADHGQSPQPLTGPTNG